jgi:hypothetical protein
MHGSPACEPSDANPGMWPTRGNGDRRVPAGLSIAEPGAEKPRSPSPLVPITPGRLTAVVAAGPNPAGAVVAAGPNPAGAVVADPNPAGAVVAAGPNPAGAVVAGPSPAGAVVADPSPAAAVAADPSPAGAVVADPSPAGAAVADRGHRVREEQAVDRRVRLARPLRQESTPPRLLRPRWPVSA